MVVGVGNVALDVTRVLIKSADELASTDMADEVLEALAAKRVTDVHVLGRRGPAYTAFTTKELRELGQIDGVDIMIDSSDLELDSSSEAVAKLDKVATRNLAVLREWADRGPGSGARRIHLHFWTRPVQIVGSSRVEAVVVEGTGLDADGFVEGTAAVAPSRLSSWSGPSAIAASHCPESRTTPRPVGCRTPRDG